MFPQPSRALRCILPVLMLISCSLEGAGFVRGPDGAWHVHPGQNIQDAVEHAARNPAPKVVKVHAGIYRPQKPGLAMIWFNHRHEGVQLEAVGNVTLTATNPDLAEATAGSYPAVVTHLVYFGDGITRKTSLKGFRITGANNFVTDKFPPESIEPRFEELRRTEGVYGSLFFYTDGGAIKVFGRSYPTLESLLIHNNFSSPCAGGISIEHRGFTRNSVLIIDCVFLGNRASVTGSAVDLLRGSAAEIRNCLFVGNLSNTETSYVPVKGNMAPEGMAELMATTYGYLPEHGSGALTVFERSFALVDRCTFTGNWNGADDRSLKSRYQNSIFWMNTATGGNRPGKRYELDITRRYGVTNCFIRGEINDLQGRVDPTQNRLNCPDPEFDERFVPQNPSFEGIGYRPAPATPQAP